MKFNRDKYLNQKSNSDNIASYFESVKKLKDMTLKAR